MCACMLPQVSDNFRKTAANFHYEFNMRHLTNVFEGLLKSHPKNFVHGEQLVHLWLHESERVYGDRLVSQPKQTVTLAIYLVLELTRTSPRAAAKA